MNKEPYILQSTGMGLGNFIQLTHSIIALSIHFQKEIPVYFEKDFVGNCFNDCLFIKRLPKKPVWMPMNDPKWCYEDKGVPEWENLLNHFKAKYGISDNHQSTYIDFPDIEDKNLQNRLVIMNGSGNYDSTYLNRKSPSIEAYKAVIKDRKMSRKKPIFIGSKEDKAINKELIETLKCEVYELNMRQSLSVVLNASHVITNDTGLAHAAGSWGQSMDVLWKNTPFTKNTNQGQNTRYVFTGNISPSESDKERFNTLEL